MYEWMDARVGMLSNKVEGRWRDEVATDWCKIKTSIRQVMVFKSIQCDFGSRKSKPSKISDSLSCVSSMGVAKPRISNRETCKIVNLEL